MAAGRGSVFLVGGAESMSQVPLLFHDRGRAEIRERSPRRRRCPRSWRRSAAFRPADFEPRIGLKLGLTDPVCGMNMGDTAEVLAREFGITRDAQDAFAHALAHEAGAGARAARWPRKSARSIRPRRAGSPFSTTTARATTRRRRCSRGLRPVFDKYGTVTAGNSSQITDGAVALLVGTAKNARGAGVQAARRARRTTPMRAAIRRAWASGRFYAIEQAGAAHGLHRLADADFVEINEAFAAQVLAVLHMLRETGREVPEDKLNVNGGSIALGHPVGATGARLMLTSSRNCSAAMRGTRARLAVRRRRPGRRALAGKERSVTNANDQPPTPRRRHLRPDLRPRRTPRRTSSIARRSRNSPRKSRRPRAAGAGRRGLILTSAKPPIFIAGADLHSIPQMIGRELEGVHRARAARLHAARRAAVSDRRGDPRRVRRRRLRSLRWPATGASRRRTTSTKIGLPETKLGILPAWGGSHAAAALIGVPGALDIILGGQDACGARHALKLGLIDEAWRRANICCAPRCRMCAEARQASARLAHSAPVNAVVDAVIARGGAPQGGGEDARALSRRAEGAGSRDAAARVFADENDSLATRARRRRRAGRHRR